MRDIRNGVAKSPVRGKPKFRADYGFTLKMDFVMLCAIMVKRSEVSARQFEHFMREIGASYETCGSGYRSVFDPLQVAAAYVVEEYAFDARRSDWENILIRGWLRRT
jgi:hypothetical protein